MRTPSWLLPATVAALLTGVLAACGSSTTTTTAQIPAAAAPAPTTTSAAQIAAAAGCRGVAQPPSKGVQHLHAPRGRLDPAKRYVVKLTTSCGEIDIQLDVRRAPITTASVASLVRSGFYNNLSFHRVVANFVIQGGDPLGNGSGGPGYEVVEPPPSNLQYTTGVVAMAKTATEPSGASGSQFFIVIGNSSPLPAQYALLGKVSAGMKVAEAIGTLPANQTTGQPAIPVVIERAVVVES
jgi:cyclophilin family peptidyl-prolyl cis-trans isomerase